MSGPVTAGKTTALQSADAFDWNRRFDEAATALMRDRPGDILELGRHDDFEVESHQAA